MSKHSTRGGPAKIWGLSDYGLTPAKLQALGNRAVLVRIQQKTYSVNRLRSLSPSKRQEQIKKDLRRGFEAIKSTWRGDDLVGRGSRSYAWTIDGKTSPKNVLELANLAEVEYVFISRIAGLKKHRKRRKLRWFAVRGLVMIQVEDQVSGNQDIEDRILMVKAFTFNDACRRLTKEWKHYAKPYLNPWGYLVRWKLEKIVDVYDLFEDHIDPQGTEVYSKLSTRRANKTNSWHPRRELRTRRK